MSGFQRKYTTGNFVAYTIVCDDDVRLGGVPDGMPVTLHKGASLEFDGQRVRYAGEEFAYPRLRSAINAGWLVEEGEEGNYTPVRNAMRVRPATDAGASKDDYIDMSATVHDEQDVGSIEDIRGKKGRFEVISADGQEGIPVAKLSSPKMGKVEIGKDDRAIVQKVNSGKLQRVPKKVRTAATGDVSEARAGQELEDLLPNAERNIPVQTPAPKRKVSFKNRPEPEPVEWDFQEHWKTRVKKLVEWYDKDPDVFETIFAAESTSVKKHAQKEIDG